MRCALAHRARETVELLTRYIHRAHDDLSLILSAEKNSNQSVNKSVDQSISQSVNQSISQSVNQSISQ